MPPRKTWREKLADSKDFPRVQPISEGMSKTWGKGTIVIPPPSEVDAIMRSVPKGKLTTINHIRETVAKRHGATIGCPICVGIFARTAAGAAQEDEAEEKLEILAEELIKEVGAFPDKSIISAYEVEPSLRKLPDYIVARTIEEIIK